MAALLSSNEDLSANKIGGAPQHKCDTMGSYLIGKGGGSAYGGEWKPSKPEDERLIGEPGTVKMFYKKDGTKIETKIGPDGRATKERHYTSAPNAKLHSNPHDHKINWSEPRMGIPNFSEPINCWGDVPEFKYYERVSDVSTSRTNSLDDNRFKTISEFKECIIRGGEPVFLWNGIRYGVCFADGGYCIAETDGSNEKICKTPDEVLEYSVGEERLRDVITQVTVIERTI